MGMVDPRGMLSGAWIFPRRNRCAITFLVVIALAEIRSGANVRVWKF
jgi:hypothetical protein